MSKEYRNLMMDQVKLRIMKWATTNPQWTPEDMIQVCKFWIKFYGLRNRYLPPDFKREEEQKNDPARVETADSGQA